MSAKIASMTCVASTPDAAMRTVGAAVSFSPNVWQYVPLPEFHEVLAKRARVALVRLQSILKPASKKDKKKPP